MLAVVLLLAAVGTAMSQRSPYASSRPFPGLLPRFRPESEEGQEAGAGLANRVNAEEPLPAGLQGTLEEDRLVQRVSQWPEDKQPFWFKNRHAVTNQRQRPADGNQQVDDGFSPQQTSGNSRRRWTESPNQNANQFQPIYYSRPQQHPQREQVPLWKKLQNSGMRISPAGQSLSGQQINNPPQQLEQQREAVELPYSGQKINQQHQKLKQQRELEQQQQRELEKQQSELEEKRHLEQQQHELEEQRQLEQKRKLEQQQRELEQQKQRELEHKLKLEQQRRELEQQKRELEQQRQLQQHKREQEHKRKLEQQQQQLEHQREADVKQSPWNDYVPQQQSHYR